VKEGQAVALGTECFSHSLVTGREKVQKYSSEKQVIGEDENEGRHPNKTMTEE